MKCEQLKQRIPDFLYDEIPEAERAEVLQHLKSCTPCGAEVNELKLVRNRLAEWKDPAMRSFPVAVPYPSPLRTLKQWLLPPRWTRRTAFTFAMTVGFVLLVTFSVLGTEVRVSKDSLTFRADLLRRMESPPLKITPRTSVNDSASSSRAAEFGEVPHAASLQDVAHMIQASEARQQQLLKTEEMRLVNQLTSSYRGQLTRLASILDNKHRLDLAAFYDSLEQQRRTDLQKIRMTFASLDELTSQQARQTQQLVDLIQKASYQPK